MSLHKERRGKRMKLVSHTLIYMDDILLTGASRKVLKMAVRSIIRFAQRHTRADYQTKLAHPVYRSDTN